MIAADLILLDKKSGSMAQFCENAGCRFDPQILMTSRDALDE
jgi:hypothetical protein